MMSDSHTLLGRKDIIQRLTCKDITKRITVSPLLSSYQIQPASLDVRLGTDFLIIKIGKITYLDPLEDPEIVKSKVEKYTDRYKILNKNDCFILHPNEFILGCTLEYVKLPKDIAARIEGRSSWGRLGISIHATAGFIDPGFCGNITFELKNMGKTPIPLYPGIRMAQLSFFEVVNEESDPGYKGKYFESFGVVPSKYFEDFEYDFIRKSRESFEDFFTDAIEAMKDGKPIPKTEKWDLLPPQIRRDLDAAYERVNDNKS
jgi:dCTP deaminase